ncbi:hypothetical protein P3719_24115 [Vibrio parahaemolyticus]|uniref:hypothetical protein n=1 Tax=Vibrio parahaemolyticus TaxID=670 RepID=UPI0011202130|nr:hypothetical protein [Vibrio parahaemolyticus]EJG1033352.1 hypothetical protein [Vibrio parahaemolyticus]EJH2591774.1 hypothetical protein [Vibrio parahaemolyticus]MBE4499000.1 hypothetical protein [Vibrio parahaemolyticus]MCA6691622.1 hypothetical protein [Vibrio parahaemolyticus]MDF5585956.1 hypothetical protein [Vibrio parahaemolyticus]
METKDIIALVIAAYGAILSTYLFVRSALNNRPRLTFIHEFSSSKDGTYLNIIATNSSEKLIDLVSLSYFIGKSKAERELLLGSTVSLEPHKSHTFRVPLNKELELTLLVDEFLFKTSKGKELPYKLNRSVLEDLRIYRLVKDTPEIHLAIEKLDALKNNIEAQSELSLKETEQIVKDFESMEKSN